MSKIEKYMNKHQFLPADKKKVYNFLREQQADVETAYLTRKELHFFSQGVHGIVSRSLLGVQINFV